MAKSMGREQPFQGDVAEKLACGYLNGSFADCGVWQPGCAVDLVCKGLRSNRASCILCYNPEVAFHFQIKKQMSPWKVQRSSFLQWLRLVETQPVVLLALQPINSKQQEWWYLCLHDWLLTEMGQDALQYE